MRGAVSSRMACVFGISGTIIRRVRLNASARGHTGPLLMRSSNQAATVSVQRESTMSSTSRTGPVRRVLRPRREKPSMLRACCDAVGHRLLLGPISVFSSTAWNGKPKAAASRRGEIRHEFGMPERRDAGHPAGRWLWGSTHAPSATQASTSSSANRLILILALPNQRTPTRIAPHTEDLRPAASDALGNLTPQSILRQPARRPLLARLEGQAGPAQETQRPLAPAPRPRSSAVAADSAAETVLGSPSRARMRNSM